MLQLAKLGSHKKMFINHLSTAAQFSLPLYCYGLITILCLYKERCNALDIFFLYRK